MIDKKTTIKFKSNYNAFYSPRPFWKRKACILAPFGRSICRPSVVSSLSFHRFAWELPNLVQKLPLGKRMFKLLIFIQLLSAHYPLTPLLVSWCRSWSLIVNILFWFSGHLVKVHGQTACLCTNFVHLISFDSIYLSLATLGTIVVHSA